MGRSGGTRFVVERATPERKRFCRRRVAAIAAGLIAGIAASQVLPAATTLVRALGDAGIGKPAAELVVMAAFAVGGIEGSLLVCPLVASLASRRRQK